MPSSGMWRRADMYKPTFLRNVTAHIPEDGFLHSHRRENIKSYKNK
jgi:hypothetical protein